VDSAWEQEKLEARKILGKPHRTPMRGNVIADVFNNFKNLLFVDGMSLLLTMH
jgi:hypothetical protein